MPRLPERWTDGLTALDTWDDKPIREAADLADALATFFARTDDKPTGAAALASRLRKSRLPRALKLALLGKAARHPDVETGTWRRVEWKHPTMRKTFHYYVQVPRCYRPGRPTPVLVSLHGQTSTAERQRLLWGEHAERHGFILISPEYIYGRRWGYKHSAEEHAAIVGALRHAGRTLSIDTDRVFIQGGSQGGHTSWDVGSTRSGLFAGVLPLIGILVFQDGLHNFPNTAVYCIDGELDGQAPVHNRRTIDQLSAAGCDAVYVEYRDRGHEAFTEEYDAVCRWMHRRVRTRTAGKLVHVGLRKTDLRCRWLQVDAKLPSRATGGHYVHLKAQVHKGPRETDILITTDRARRVSVLVDPDVVDLSLPLHVRVDGKTRFRGAVKIDWRFALESSYHRRDRQERFVRRLTFPVRRR